MSLKIEQECDWCNRRESVELSGRSLDLTNIPLPENWEKKAPFPDSDVGPRDSQELCSECASQYEPVLEAAKAARDRVLLDAMNNAKMRRQGQAPGGPARAARGSSSFATVS